MTRSGRSQDRLAQSCWSSRDVIVILGWTIGLGSGSTDFGSHVLWEIPAIYAICSLRTVLDNAILSQSHSSCVTGVNELVSVFTCITVISLAELK